MEKKHGPSSESYVLVTILGEIVEENQLMNGDLVQLWAFSSCRCLNVKTLNDLISSIGSEEGDFDDRPPSGGIRYCVFHYLAAPARITRQAITAKLSHGHVIRRALSTSAAATATATTDAKPITPSADRAKWDGRGQRQIIPLDQWVPKVAAVAYVAPNVTVCDGASVWPGSVLRGDLRRLPLVSAPICKRMRTSRRRQSFFFFLMIIGFNKNCFFFFFPPVRGCRQRVFLFFLMRVGFIISNFQYHPIQIRKLSNSDQDWEKFITIN
ncbi:gamma carbonic anhydrase-like 2 [Citrus sinensis]|nr:gamma carbonic anhydrase-like 2 [Citrus sinensis]